MENAWVISVDTGEKLPSKKWERISGSFDSIESANAKIVELSKDNNIPVERYVLDKWDVVDNPYDPQIEGWFTYHTSSEEQQKRYVEMRAAAKNMAYAIKANTKPSADQTHAFRLLRSLVMFANASIALE